MVVPKQDLKKEVEQLSSNCAGFHLDIMDDIFVSHHQWDDPDEINEVVTIAQRVWVHLMVQKPEDFYQRLDLPDGSLVSFHIESDANVEMMIKTIKEKNHRVSLAIRPKTPIELVESFVNIIDQVLVMSVEPGQSGQPFLESAYKKIAELVVLRERHGADFRIGVDGGINKRNIARVIQSGGQDFAIATGIFGEKDHLETLQELLGSNVGVR
jgi:ribulose-phosphate 3-epimerase